MDRRRRKNAKYFLSLEKKNYLNKVITSLNVNGKIISNPKEILTAEHNYFLDCIQIGQTLQMNLI